MKGVLLVNLGTPAAPTPQAIRPWLREFLLDERVIDLPRLLWLPLLYGVILPLRPKMLAQQYAHIWRPDGAPLLAITREQRAALQDQFGDSGLVVEAMRYGEPSIGRAIGELQRAGVKQLVVLPLYPQYSDTTTASALDAVNAALAHLGWQPRLKVIKEYHADRGYIAALAASVREHWAMHGHSERLLMSFHGIPRRYADRGDPYEMQCVETARLLASALGLKEGHWQVAYQSRVGRAEWLTPYTDAVIEQMARAGTRNLDVICPGFSADCLETLDEIAVRYRHQFVAAGGHALRYVPALNARPAHIAALARLVKAQFEAA